MTGNSLHVRRPLFDLMRSNGRLGNVIDNKKLIREANNKRFNLRELVMINQYVVSEVVRRQVPDAMTKVVARQEIRVALALHDVTKAFYLFLARIIIESLPDVRSTKIYPADNPPDEIMHPRKGQQVFAFSFGLICLHGYTSVNVVVTV